MENRKNKYGRCRICGKQSKLTLEHILPRVAGGGKKVKLFTGDEFIKAAVRECDHTGSKNDDKPFGIIKQSGLTDYTLCKSCNSHSGIYYDKDFANFYRSMQNSILYIANEQGIHDSEELDNFLSDKGMELKLSKAKPNNIAKRILVSFCSVEHEGLTDRKLEIRKAILDKDYVPKTDGFSIYLTPHIGGDLYYGTLSALTDDGIHNYAGIEIGAVAFYLAEHDAHIKGGPLAKCIDITDWLTKYKYDEEVDLDIRASFEKGFALNITPQVFE